MPSVPISAKRSETGSLRPARAPRPGATVTSRESRPRSPHGAEREPAGPPHRSPAFRGAWRDRPEHVGPWATTWSRFRRWAACGRPAHRWETRTSGTGAHSRAAPRQGRESAAHGRVGASPRAADADRVHAGAIRLPRRRKRARRPEVELGVRGVTPHAIEDARARVAQRDQRTVGVAEREFGASQLDERARPPRVAPPREAELHGRIRPAALAGGGPATAWRGSGPTCDRR